MRFVKEAGANAVKLERGMRPPSPAPGRSSQAGSGDGSRWPDTADVDGTRWKPCPGPHAQRATRIAHEALALQDAGCFSIVFEAMPAEVTASSCR